MTAMGFVHSHLDFSEGAEEDVLGHAPNQERRDQRKVADDEDRELGRHEEDDGRVELLPGLSWGGAGERVQVRRRTHTACARALRVARRR